MRTPSNQPTPKQLQKLISHVAKIIGQCAAEGRGEPAGLHNAKTELQTAQQAFEAGDYDQAREKYDAAMDYVTKMTTEAYENLKQRTQT
jgi:hypothetical protein